MKTILKPLALMFFLSFELNHQAHAQLNMNEYIADREAMPATNGTQVYLGDKNHEMAVLENDFPRVAARFCKLYPAAQTPLWIKEGKFLFAYFQNEGNKVSAVFTINGFWAYATTQLNAKDLPESIKEYLVSTYPSYKIAGVKKSEAWQNTSFEILIENRIDRIKIITEEEKIVSAEPVHK